MSLTDNNNNDNSLDDSILNNNMSSTSVIGSGSYIYSSGTVTTSTLPSAIPISNGSFYTIGSSNGTTWIDPYTNIERRLDKIEKSLLIIKPDLVLHEKYPALKEAYDYYQLMLKMVENKKE